MKKSVVSALTAALAIGMASTTFAAANPFSDVPADHWAYDAIAQLTADGVTSGYGDGTYRGPQEITRYEMAVMVARAMAKSGLSASDRAMLDKLSAEFADELNALGVRVAALEKKVDNVKWPGEIRYRYKRTIAEGKDERKHSNTNWIRFRVNPVMTINKHWVGKARVEYDTNLNDAANKTSCNVDRTWVEGKYGNTLIKLGKLPHKQESDYGLTHDWVMAGGMVTFGKDIKVGLVAGRVDIGTNGTKFAAKDGDGNAYNMQGIDIYNNRKNKFTWGLGYQRANGKGHIEKITGKSTNGIWDVGLGYKFTKQLSLQGAYARGQAEDDSRYGDTKHKQSYSVELDYGKINRAKPGSYKLFLAYRHIGEAANIRNTYSVFNGWDNGGGQKGFEIGGHVVLDKNIVGELIYIKGKYLDDDKNGKDKNKFSTLWSQVHFYF